jgi:nucleotide-binding universal stress UspA family protein
MSEAILVLLRHPEEAGLLLDAAARLADIMGAARVNALAIQETTEVTPAGALTLADRSDAILTAKDQERRRVAALERSFAGWSATAAKHGSEAHWFAAEGNTTDIVAQWGRRADVVVATRPSREDRLDRQAFRMALFGTDRPILMVPPRREMPEAATTFGRRIAIAWRDEKQAHRAVLPALRWLAGAEQMHVLVGVRDTTQRLDLPPVLLEHALTANVHVLAIRPGPFGQTLLDAAHRLGADLLVMGAYAHNPLRELILGGVTRHMLAHANLPVLMRH